VYLLWCDQRQYKGRSPVEDPGQITYSTLALKLAATARHAVVDHDLAVEVMLRLDPAANEHPAVVAQASFWLAL
jgi:hypothetical protein